MYLKPKIFLFLKTLKTFYKHFININFKLYEAIKHFKQYIIYNYNNIYNNIRYIYI